MKYQIHQRSFFPKHLMVLLVFSLGFVSFIGGEVFGQKQQSIESFDTSLCKYLYKQGRGYGQGMQYKKGYDTLRLFIENCAMGDGSWSAFNDIEGDLADMDTSRQRWVDGREWFKKVLYYNPDTNYYCSDVFEMLNTFAYFEGRGTPDYLGYLAVVKYLKDNHKCLSWYFVTKEYDKTYREYMDSTINMWRDTVKDSLKTPIDTTLPSIDELGLGILRGQNGVVSAGGVTTSAIGNLSLAENPFHSEAILRYHLNSSAMVRVDIYDELGRRMSGEGEGYKREGDYQIKFDAHSWSSGVYYLRLSTMSGEVRTIKLIRDK